MAPVRRLSKFKKRRKLGIKFMRVREVPHAKAFALTLSPEIPIEEQIKKGELTFLAQGGKGKIIEPIVDENAQQLVGVFNHNQLIITARFVNWADEIHLSVYDQKSGKKLRQFNYGFSARPWDMTHMRLPEQLIGTGISDKIFQIADAHARAVSITGIYGSVPHEAKGPIEAPQQTTMISLLKRAGYTISKDLAYKHKPAKPWDNLNTHFKILITNPKTGREQYLSWKKPVKGK